MTTQIAWTGSSPIAHSRCGDDESNAIDPPGPNSYCLEADLHAEHPARDVAVLLAAVCRQRVLRARRGSHRIDDVEELDVAIAVTGQPFPAHPGREVDHRRVSGALGQAAADLGRHPLLRR